MEVQYATRGQGNLATTLGAIGTGLSLFNGGLGLFGNNGYHSDGGRFVTKDELDYVQTISAKDSEIALLKSEANTEVKIADVYERIMTRVNADAKAQAEVNAGQAVYNATANSAIAVLQNQVGVLNSLTKTVIPNSNVCPGWGSVTVMPTTTGTTFA